ncbi:MAG: FAD-dependent oxidoreductase [Ruminococcaceae bacterium]|nr:FAD-dependent oxidoreductase [Oscillospiraceae bacterium]
MYDIIVVGAGPAGLTAALYARRADKSVLVIEKETFGGQITYSPRVENYPGFLVMSGNEFAEKLIDQVTEQGAEIEMDTVTGIEGEAGDFTVHGKSADYKAKAVIIAAGSKHRQLGLPKENELIGEGVSYCAVCDGAFYRGKTVAVIGGGNTALQEAIALSEGCTKVYVVQNLGFLTGEERLQKDIEQKDNITVILGKVVKELLGDKAMTGIVIADNDGNTETLELDGIFVAIGQKPENEPFKDILSLDEWGYIQSGEDCLPEGAKEGVFVAGDCRTKKIRQVTTATGDGAVAALAACRFIDNL